MYTGKTETLLDGEFYSVLKSGNTFIYKFDGLTCLENNLPEIL